MKVLVAFPGNASFAVQAALALEERGALEAFYTSFAYDPGHPASRLLKAMPGARLGKLASQLERRTIRDLPSHRVEQRPMWEVLRSIAAQAGFSATTVDRVWDRASRDFTRAAARRLRPGIDAIYAYEFTALEVFEQAERTGAAKILDLPSLSSRGFEELQRSQRRQWPELGSSDDEYFDTRFEERQARRDEEIRRADVIVANSKLTKASHVAFGAEPQRTVVVPYGAPPTVAVLPERPVDRPLRCLWAGSFSLRKGAHLLIDAWRGLARHAHAQVDIYGAVTLPASLLSRVPSGMNFKGSVSALDLYAAYDGSDVLIFPTLSDGFGMVVTEALSRGLPVIVTDQAGAADLVRHEENGLIIPAGDAHAIRDAVQWCLDNRAGLVAMGQAALETARGWQWADYRRALYAALTSRLSVQDGLVSPPQ